MLSSKPIANLQTTTDHFARFSTKINEGKSALSKMVNDQKFTKILDSTMSNLQSRTKSFRENMES